MSIASFSSLDFGLETILEQLCVNLQLTDTQVKRVRQSYGAVTTWVAGENSIVAPYSPLIYPQGSLALDTTVKPIHQVEFDLDVICVLEMGQDRTPKQVYDLIWDRMYQHEFYRGIMIPLDRCIRLDYAKDSQFHLDIVPAIADPNKGGTHILIIDKEGSRLVFRSSNPKGFRRWYEAQKVVLMEKFARAVIEPFASPLPSELKAVLSKCVQLIKRWRDVKWNDDPSLATPSIVLTYLAADYYHGEGTIIEAMGAILRGMEQFVESGVRILYNPANGEDPAEIITEKWNRNPACYAAFAEAITGFREEWELFLSHKRGVRLYEALAGLFGDQATRAIKDVSEPITTARTNGALFADKDKARLLISSPAALSAVRVKPNTHFGN